MVSRRYGHQPGGGGGARGEKLTGLVLELGSVLLNRGSVGMLKGLLQKAPLKRRAINGTWGGWHFAVILVRFVVVVGVIAVPL